MEQSEENLRMLAAAQSKITTGIIGVVLCSIVLVVGGAFTLLCVAWANGAGSGIGEGETAMIVGCLLFLGLFILSIRLISKGSSQKRELLSGNYRPGRADEKLND